jgi:UDP-N-acetylmuramoyl-tripeptide--D-alanyl-D-alanine ligase
MRTIKKILQWKLRAIARLTIWRYRPFIIGVTGSVGKTSTKLATSVVLSGSTSVRAARGNLNNELGFPLAILGDYDGYKTGGALFWIGAIISGIFGMFFRRNYPKVLVLEYGADHPGDLDYLLGIARPDIAIVTAIGKVPVHVEFYPSPEDVIREKSKLVRGVKSGGTVILNFDDPAVMTMKDMTKERVVTYGFNQGADIRIFSFENRSESGRPIGVYFKLQYKGSFVPIKIEGVLGKSQAYSAAAAAAVALERDVNLVTVSELLSLYRGERGRTQIIEGADGTYIIDDTYNASPVSVESALEIFKEISSTRKVAVLGDMAELGNFSEEAHKSIGAIVAGVADLLVTVGSKSVAMAGAAIAAGMNKGNVVSFGDSKTAAVKIKEFISPKDVILVKGSQSMRMEKIVLALMAEPDKAHDLLVRQYGKWLTT